MGRLRKGLSLFLCAILVLTLFSACFGGDGGAGQVTYGRYVEADISPEGMTGYPMAFATFESGVLDLVARDEKYEGDRYTYTTNRWRSTDNGATWQQMNMDWAKAYENNEEIDYSQSYEQRSLGNMLLMENGDMLVEIYHSSYDAETEMYASSSELARVTQDGTQTPYSIPEFDQAVADGTGNTWINRMMALPGGRFYFQYYSDPGEDAWNDPDFDYNSTEKRAVYDINTGDKLYDVNYNGWDIYYNNTTLFIYDYDQGFQALNLSDGSPSNAPMPSDEMLQRLSNNYAGGTFVDDNNNFYSVTARGMYKYPVEGGSQPVASSQVQSSSTGGDSALAVSGQAGAADESDEPEQVMDGLNYTFGSPLYSISAMSFDPESEIITMAVYEYNSTDYTTTGRLLQYKWDDDAVASSDKTIRVYSLYENYSVRLALSEFKRQHPEVFVEYETAFTDDTSGGGVMPLDGSSSSSGGGTGQTIEDAERALNTELLNGTGPDVIILDGLSIDSLSGKGVLIDLSDIVQGNSDLYTEIMNPMLQGGKQYVIPTNFFVPTLFGEKGYVEQFADFDTLMNAIQSGVGLPAYQEYDPNWSQEEMDAYYNDMYTPKPDEEQPVMYFESLDDVFNTFYTTCAPSLFNDQDGINQQNLSRFLQGIKEVSDKYELTNPDSSSYGSSGSVMISGNSYYNYQNNYSATLSRYTSRQSRLGYSRLGSTNILMNVSYNLFYSTTDNMMGKTVAMEVEYDEEGNPIEPAEPVAEDVAETETQTLPKANPAAALAPGFSTGVYIPTQMVGVTSTSKQTELAKEFVSTMLSFEVQKHDMGNGFPVSRSAFQTIYDGYLTMNDRMASADGDNPAMMEYDYEGIVSQLTTPMFEKEYLYSVIYEPVYDYCAGNRSLEDVVSRIVNETELYFAERQ